MPGTCSPPIAHNLPTSSYPWRLSGVWLDSPRNHHENPGFGSSHSPQKKRSLQMGFPLIDIHAQMVTLVPLRRAGLTCSQPRTTHKQHANGSSRARATRVGAAQRTCTAKRCRRALSEASFFSSDWRRKSARGGGRARHAVRCSGAVRLSMVVFGFVASSTLTSKIPHSPPKTRKSL